MASTNFKGRSGSGPVIGALQVVPIVIDVAASTTVTREVVQLPAGAGFEVVGVQIAASAVTGTVMLTMGTVAAGTQVASSIAIATDLGALTIKDGTIAAGGVLYLQAIAAGGETATKVQAQIWGHVSSEPTVTRKR